MSEKPKCVELQAANMEAWRAIRHEMLTQHPDAFTDYLKENLQLTQKQFITLLKTNKIFTLQRKGRILTILCIQLEASNEKTKRTGLLWGVYTPKDFRQKGYSRMLFQHVLFNACAHFTVLTLTCNKNNTRAIQHYQKLGFHFYGMESITTKRVLEQPIRIIRMARTLHASSSHT